MLENLNNFYILYIGIMVLGFLFCLTVLPIKRFTVEFQNLNDVGKLEAGVFTLTAVMFGLGNFCILGTIFLEGVSLQYICLLIVGIIAEIIAIRTQQRMIERNNQSKTPD